MAVAAHQDPNPQSTTPTVTDSDITPTHAFSAPAPAPLVGLLESADPVPLEVVVLVTVELPLAAVNDNPNVGIATSPSSPHPPDSLVGHAGGLKLGEYEALGVPVGVSVAQWLWRFVKSGVMGVGVPVRVYPPWTALSVVVAAASEAADVP